MSGRACKGNDVLVYTRISSFPTTRRPAHTRTMGKSAPMRAGYTANLGTLIDAGIHVRVLCTEDGCGYRDIDLVALADKIGRDRSLWNKRVRCRLTEGCPGVNRFFEGGRGLMRGMFD